MVLTRSQRQRSLANVPFAHVPIELTTIILDYVAHAHVETPRTEESDALHQICTFKLVCRRFAAIGDLLLAKEARCWYLSPLKNIVCEPTKQSLKMMQTIAANDVLRPLIMFFICVDDDRCYRDISKASSFIADTVSVVRQFPDRKGFAIEPTWKRWIKMFAPWANGRITFLAWFWEVIRIVNEAERDHMLMLANVETSFLRPRIVHEKLDEIMANVTMVTLQLECASTLLTKEEVSGCWGLVLQKARRLSSVHLDVLNLSREEATRVWQGLLKGQYWPCLGEVTLAGPVIHDVVMDFLVANKDSLCRIDIPYLAHRCAREVVKFLDFLFDNLTLFGASIRVPPADVFRADCSHLDDWYAIIDELVERDGPAPEWGFHDVGFYVLYTEECSYNSEEEYWHVVRSNED